jgi:hypothetical protein
MRKKDGEKTTKNTETMHKRDNKGNKGGKSTNCGVIPLIISCNKSLVILSRMAKYKLNVFNVLYVYMCIDETIVKNKYICNLINVRYII